MTSCIVITIIIAVAASAMPARPRVMPVMNAACWTHDLACISMIGVATRRQAARNALLGAPALHASLAALIAPRAPDPLVDLTNGEKQHSPRAGDVTAGLKACWRLPQPSRIRQPKMSGVFYSHSIVI